MTAAKMRLAILVAVGLLGAGCTTVDVEKLESDVADGISDKLRSDVTVDCPDEEVREAADGGSFECTARNDKGDEQPVDVTLDGEGTAEWKFQSP